MLCAVTIPPADLRSLSLYYDAVCGRLCMSSVRVWCSCLLVIVFTVFCIVCTVFLYCFVYVHLFLLVLSVLV